MIGYKTFSAKPAQVKANWYLVDAEGKTLGRLAAELAKRLRGKHKPIYTPHVDCGDYLVVINSSKIAVSGNKRTHKKYYRYTGYVGNMKEFTFEELIQRSPNKVIELAVKGMLPRGPLGRAMIKKLKVFSGQDHPHQAQQPQPLDI